MRLDAAYDVAVRLTPTLLILALACPASLHAQAPAADAASPGTAASPNAPSRRPTRARRSRASAVAGNVAFHVNPDGTSRCAVHVRGSATPRSSASARRFEVVLPGAVPATRNDLHPLETEFFNTPMRRAALVRRGHDLVLVLELRADVTPTLRVESDPAGGQLVVVDLPAGQFAPTPAPSGTASVRPSEGPAPEPSPSRPASTPAPRASAQPAQPATAQPAPAQPAAPRARSSHDDDELPPGLR